MNDASASSGPPPIYYGIATTAAGGGELETFLEARGLDPELASRIGFGISNGRIEIPYVRNGKLVYRKYRNIAKKGFSCDAGQEPFFWNIDVLKDESLVGHPLIITEGEFDALAAIQAGYPRTISVPNGGPKAKDEERTFGYLDDVGKDLRGVEEVILAVDNDEVGTNLLEALSLQLGRARCKWIRYPKGCKDLNQALEVYGVRGVKAALETATWIKVNGVYLLDGLPPLSEKVAYDIDIPGMEKHINLRLGDFSVWTGIPGSGKTTFLTDVMCRVVDKHGFKVAFASFEQPPQTEHRRALRTWKMGKYQKFMTDAEKAEADRWIQDRFVFIVPDEDDDVSLKWVMEKCAAAVLRHGVHAIVIDPWNEMDHDVQPGQTETQYTSMAIRQFRRFAKKHNVHLAMVVHPAKMSRDKNGKYAIPSLYDISGSSHWYNKTELGIVVHRGNAEAGESAQIIIAKTKYESEIGVRGVVDVLYMPDTGRYQVKQTYRPPGLYGE